MKSIAIPLYDLNELLKGNPSTIEKYLYVICRNTITCAFCGESFLNIKRPDTKYCDKCLANNAANKRYMQNNPIAAKENQRKYFQEVRKPRLKALKERCSCQIK